MRPLVLLTAGLLLVSGCGGLADSRAATGPSDAPPVGDRIAGTRVGAMAERELELNHPGMAVGRITCPDLVLVVGRSVRCERIAVLSGGRQVRVRGTVTVTGLDDGGRLHVALDDDVTEFGVAARELTDELTSALAARREKPTGVRCPYLLGKAGHAVRCTVRLGSKVAHVVAKVTGVDPGSNATKYEFDWSTLPGPAQRSLAYVATGSSGVVDYPRDDRSRAAA